MAVEAVAKSARFNISLAAGTDPVTGKAKSKNITFSGLRGNVDPAKVYNIVTALAPNLVYSVAGITATEVKTIQNS